MENQHGSVCPIGIVVNGVVASRIRALVDEYGALCRQGDGASDRRRGLCRLLRVVLRNLRLQAVEGDRFRLVRRGDRLEVEPTNDGAVGR